jgi:hypothetical protein
MGNVLNNRCNGNENTYFMLNSFFFSRKARVYETVSRNMVEVEGATSGLAIRRI